MSGLALLDYNKKKLTENVFIVGDFRNPLTDAILLTQPGKYVVL